MPRKQVGSLYKKTPDARRWTAAYTNPFDGKRKVVVLFTDKQASRRQLDQLIAEAERQATGLGDPFAEQRRRPLQEHIGEYIEHCQRIGESPVHVKNKKSQLERLVAGIGATRLSDLEPNRVEKHLHELALSGRRVYRHGDRDAGLSARSVNQHRATVVAFVQWCVRNRRTSDNPLKILGKLDERKDRRRVRRAFTEDELSRLLDVAGPRRPIYLLALLTGLRRGELGKITWADVDLHGQVIRVRVGVGKAAREDHVPLHPQAVEALAQIKARARSATDRVIPTLPRDKTFRRDLERAGIQRFDDQGRVVDFHALRTTTGTMLARMGIAPQIVTRIMRHSNMAMTLKHYTDLRLHDEAKAVEGLPWIGQPKAAPREAQRATGTTGGPTLAVHAGFFATAMGGLDSTPAGNPVVAHLVALRAHSGASSDTAMHKAPESDQRLRIVPAGGPAAQTVYTADPSTGVRSGAKGRSGTKRKSCSGNNLRAIGAVG